MYDVEANNKSVKANNNRYVIFGEEEIIYFQTLVLKSITSHVVAFCRPNSCELYKQTVLYVPFFPESKQRQWKDTNISTRGFVDSDLFIRRWRKTSMPSS